MLPLGLSRDSPPGKLPAPFVGEAALSRLLAGESAGRIGLGAGCCFATRPGSACKWPGQLPVLTSRGERAWAFADFRTAQSVLRVATLNHKGVCTRERKPKLAAHRLRGLWSKPA
jgi:hypothetical protein